MQFNIMAAEMTPADRDAAGIQSNDKTDVSLSNDGTVVLIHRLLADGENIQTVAADEFPAATSFYQIKCDRFSFDIAGFEAMGEVVDGSTHLIGTVKYNPSEDMFSCVLRNSSQEFELAHGNIVLNPETRVPYFECPQTTYHRGAERGDQMLTARQLAELETGRSTTLREGQAGKPN